MTLEELAGFNGQNGQPSYVAVGGIVYDVSTSPLWAEGAHEGIHKAGRDLTEELKSAPHIAAVVERFPSVGRLTVQTATNQAKGSRMTLAAILFAALILALLFLR